MNARNARFIAFEGVEGAGKSTQLKRLKEYFGDRVVFTREPGGSPYSEEIRQLILHSEHAAQADALTRFALFWSARRDHLKNTIIPALEAGKHVIVDRFDSATYAYQIHGQEFGELKKLFFVIRDEYLGEYKPDRYVFFDLDPEVGSKRKMEQVGEQLNHFDTRPLDFHKRVRVGLKEFADHVPHQFIDASKPVDEVTTDLLEILKREFNEQD